MGTSHRGENGGRGNHGLAAHPDGATGLRPPPVRGAQGCGEGDEVHALPHLRICVRNRTRRYRIAGIHPGTAHGNMTRRAHAIDARGALGTGHFGGTGIARGAGGIGVGPGFVIAALVGDVTQHGTP